MSHFVRLQWIARVTYYVGWIALACGALVQFGQATPVFVALGVNKRNLFELCVVAFLICMASELRALALVRSQAPTEMPTVAKKQAAA